MSRLGSDGGSGAFAGVRRRTWDRSFSSGSGGIPKLVRCARDPRERGKLGTETHRAILRLQGLNALGDVAIVDVVAVDVHEMLEGRRLVAGGFVGGGQFVVERDAGFAIDGRHLESLSYQRTAASGHSFFEEALGQPGVSLHDLRESMSAIEGLASLLEFSDGLVEQSHFAESDAEVVVRLGIFVGGGDIGFEILLEFAKHFGEIDACVFAERRRLGGRSRRCR